jgi:hypothetical protein
MFRSLFVLAAGLACALTLCRGGQGAEASSAPVGMLVTADGRHARFSATGDSAVVDQTAASLTIVASPSALNNPMTTGGNTGPQTLTISVSASGLAAAAKRQRRVQQSELVTVTVYAPPGAVTPPSVVVPLTGNTATARFTYNGTYFSTPMTVTAVLGNGSMTAPVFMAHHVPCTYGSTPAFLVSQRDPLQYGASGGFRLRMSIAGGDVRGVQLDTGSTGFLISASALKKSNPQQIVGPGQIGFETLEPSGLMFVGHYYLAPVTLMDPNKSQVIAQTIPMEVLAVEFVCSPGSKCKPENSVALMGVGFGRPTPPPGQLYLKTPLENTFLQLQDAVEGTLHSGYVLSKDHLWLGLSGQSTSNFEPSSFARLKKFPQRPGDWEGPPGCLSFNRGSYQCGSMLLDIGISGMIAAGFAKQQLGPSSLEQIAVEAPSPTQPTLSYSFTYPVASAATPPAPDPNFLGQGHSIEWLPSSGPTPFLNTGRSAIAAADYLYDAACGYVGFSSSRT